MVALEEGVLRIDLILEINNKMMNIIGWIAISNGLVILIYKIT